MMGGSSKAANAAKAAIGKGTAYTGLCEKFTRTCFGFTAKYGSANLAYLASKAAGHFHTGDTNPPAGVPVYWDITAGTNKAYDHVAVSIGGGYCVSTSAGPGRTVAKVRITDLTRRWGMKYRGWAEIYHGQRVYKKTSTGGPSSSSSSSSSSGFRVPLKRGHTGNDVRKLQTELNRWKTALAKLYIDGQYGSRTERRVEEWQRRNHGHAYPKTARVDGIAGRLTLKGLGLP